MDISQFYQFNPLDGGTAVMVRRGAAIPKIVSGGARWKVVNRPKRTSIVLYDGEDLYRMDVPVLFDGWSDSQSQESAIAKLNQMKFSQSKLTRPTRVRVDGALPVKGATWVVEDISWGDDVIWDAADGKGARFRADAVVHLLQYLPEVTLAGLKPFKITDTVVTAKAGQTIKDLAKGDPKQAKAIQKANDIRDPKTIKPGDKVRVPGPKFPSSKFV